MVGGRHPLSMGTFTMYSLAVEFSRRLSALKLSLACLCFRYQANLTRLEQVEGDKTEMMVDIEREKRMCQKLKANVDKQQIEVSRS